MDYIEQLIKRSNQVKPYDINNKKIVEVEIRGESIEKQITPVNHVKYYNEVKSMGYKKFSTHY